MKCFVLTLALVALAHGLPQQQLRQRPRDGRQLDTNYGAPAAAESAPAVYGGPIEGLESRVEEADQASYASGLEAQASELDHTQTGAPSGAGGAAAEGRDGDENSGDPIAMLRDSVPGTPGEDYPIYAEAPETKFTCDGKLNGGYYADPEAECQAFHICTADLEGSLAKYSFLCPNGTIFNQEYFICDWWFNVDCSKAEALATSRNAELEAARGEADAKAAEANLEAAASGRSESIAPRGQAPLSSYGVGEDAAASDAQPALTSYGTQ